MDILGSFDIRAVLGPIFSGLLFVIIGIAVIGIALGFTWIASFKHTFVRRVVVNGRKKAEVRKFKEVTDKDGIVWYKVTGIKGYVPAAPPEAVEITSRGKMLVEAYYLEGEYVYLKDRGSVIPEEVTSLTEEEIDNIPKHILEIKDKQKRDEAADAWAQTLIQGKIRQWKTENTSINAYQPFTTKQRALLVSQLKSAQQWKKKNIWEHMTTIASLAALTILVVSMMIFYADMAQPLLDMGDKYNQNVRIQQETLLIIQGLKEDIQILKGESAERATGEPPN